MGIFDFLKQPDINKGVMEYRNTNSAVLLDVRTPQEYREGHIPGSENVPLQQLDNVEEEFDDEEDAEGADALSASHAALSGMPALG